MQFGLVVELGVPVGDVRVVVDVFEPVLPEFVGLVLGVSLFVVVVVPGAETDVPAVVGQGALVPEVVDEVPVIPVEPVAPVVEPVEELVPAAPVVVDIDPGVEVTPGVVLGVVLVLGFAPDGVDVVGELVAGAVVVGCAVLLGCAGVLGEVLVCGDVVGALVVLGRVGVAGGVDVPPACASASAAIEHITPVNNNPFKFMMSPPLDCCIY